MSVSEANLDVKRVSSVRSQKFRKIKRVYSPVVEKARGELNSISADRKKNDSDELLKIFVKKRCEYRKIVRSELKLERDTRITDLCSALEVDEKSFWKLIKGKRSAAHFGSFIIDGKLSSSPVEIINMWFEHFKCLGIPITHNHYDSSFCDFVANAVVTKFKSVLTDKSNSFDINSPIEEPEVVSVCKSLTDGTAGGICQTTYEHINLADHPYGMYCINCIIRCLNLQLFQPSP